MRKILLLTFLFNLALSQNDFRPSNEYLEYNVYWKFLTLGKIKVWTKLESDSIHLKIEVKSNPLIFFVYVNFTTESSFRIDSLYDAPLKVYEVKDNRMLSTHFFRDDGKIRAVMRDETNGRIVGMKSINYEQKFMHALTAFIFARWMCDDGSEVNLPIIFATEEKRENPPFVFRIERVKFNFSGEKLNVKISTVKKPIQVIEFTGFAPFVSKELAGITGEFKGWLSDDWGRVPIRAVFNTFLGNVYLELVKWEKSGWSPPYSK